MSKTKVLFEPLYIDEPEDEGSKLFRILR